jgi:hypothetical protein
VGALARRLDLAPVGPEIALLGGAGEEPRTALGRVWRVVASESSDPRRVRALLAEHGIGPVTVRKRGHAESSESLARRYRGPGERRGTVLVARLAAGHRAWLVEPSGSLGLEQRGEDADAE